MTENKMTVFNNSEFGQIRTLESNGKIMFCGADVAKALGYSNTRKALADHCKGNGVTKCYIIYSMGREQEATFISEGNVYRLIVRSKLPDAEKFETWLFDTMLPTINKTGGYVISGREQEFINNNPAIVAELQQLRTAVEIMQAQLMATPDDLITAVAKALGYSKPCATVYSKIYSRMNTARGWKHMLTRHKCRTKKELIENNKEYGALYVKCCNEILNEHR